MKLKVCGLKDSENIRDIAVLCPDFIGLNFYNKSNRFVGDDLDGYLIKSLDKNIKKVGVFVNAEMEEIYEKTERYLLDFVQLHGNEPPEYCKILKANGIDIIKAFGIDKNFDFKITGAYMEHCKYFLFDTKHSGYGGSGKKFEWDILKNYELQKPFFLSGGISLDNIAGLSEIDRSQLFCLDVNSKFELEPGIKDAGKIKLLIECMKHNFHN